MEDVKQGCPDCGSFAGCKTLKLLNWLDLREKKDKWHKSITKKVWEAKLAFEQQFGYPDQKCSSVTISTNAL